MTKPVLSEGRYKQLIQEHFTTQSLVFVHALDLSLALISQPYVIFDERSVSDFQVPNIIEY